MLSLFDGISGTQQALKNLGIECDYFASEIDPYAIKVTQKNFPNTVQLGDVKNVQVCKYQDNGYISCDEYLAKIKLSERFPIIHKMDLLCGGSPCQDLSIAKKDRKGLDGERSGLFFEYVRILNEVKPKFFILENVASMSKEAKQEITSHLYGIEPVMINSALLTAQNRKRIYWVGKLQEDDTYARVDIPQPQDKGILLKDVLESGNAFKEKSYCIDACYYKGSNLENTLKKSRRTLIAEPITKPKYEIIKKEYEKRVNNIDVQFNIYLKDRKQLMNKTINDISQFCNEPKTKIEHYFRTDISRAIPSKSTYYKLKNILQLDNRFDKHIEETEILISSYEQNLRVYDINYKAPTLTSSCNTTIRIGHFNTGGQGDRIYSIEGKSVSLSANGGGRGAKTGLYKIDLPDGDYQIRKLTPNECARLQGFPDNYTQGISNTQAYKCYGNSFTVPVIEHILKHLTL